MNQSQALGQYISQLVGMPVTLSVSQSDKKSFSVFQPANKSVHISAKQSASQVGQSDTQLVSQTVMMVSQ